ncbi:3-deoxy-8-phosphooctulonate synthase [Patescibacteria group bacterium]|nr:MAG: 3-deoxy-8-phosphooctulonate synthase [Patescibacteria group bacterium]
MKQKIVRIKNLKIGNNLPLVFIVGPCVLESEAVLEQTARTLKSYFSKRKISWILKCSFDKANRTSLRSFRGLGMEEGLEILSAVGKKYKIPVTTDVHEPWQANLVAEYVDLLQIPAFLCRQTDLIVACARSGKPVNVKKGQFLSPWDVRYVIEKIESTGNRKILLTERGTTFGYSNLIVDMRSLEIMKSFGYPIIFDATHSVQLPGAGSGKSGGERKYALPLARAAVAVGIAGVFFETHPNPAKALSDGPNQISLKDVPAFVSSLLEIDKTRKRQT